METIEVVVSPPVGPSVLGAASPTQLGPTESSTGNYKPVHASVNR
jgi:hypothetical protein